MSKKKYRERQLDTRRERERQTERERDRESEREKEREIDREREKERERDRERERESTTHSVLCTHKGEQKNGWRRRKLHYEDEKAKLRKFEATSKQKK